MKSLKFLLPLGLFVVLALFLGAGLKLNPREVPSPLIGKPAPEFKLALLHEPENTVSRQDLLGQVWILNVWASWCVACREEHPDWVAFARANSSVLIYGLNYKDKRPDGLGWLQRLGIDFGVYGVPETFVIDRQGVIRYKHIGPVTPEVLRDKIAPLVKSLQT
jgi:cytochrome c biogenesis protein CcmG/thiol:disulfide interchange protein DsbE